MNDIKFSIVVPIYNIAFYKGVNLFEKCIQSILNQTYTNIEIILVDDGAKDDAPQQCDVFAQVDSRLIVIHQQNRGAAAARNVGIQHASGDYIIFVDADDEIDVRSCEIFADLLMAHPDLDIIASNAKFIYKNDIEYRSYTPTGSEKTLTGRDFIIQQVKNYSFIACTWSHVIKRNYLFDNNLFFREDLKSGEDLEWAPRLYLPAKSVITSDFYHYTYNCNLCEVSLSNPKDPSGHSIPIILFCYDLEKQFSSIEDSELRKCMMVMLVRTWLYAFRKGRLYRREYRYLIQKKFLKGKAINNKGRITIYAFLLSPFLYYHFYRLLQAIRNNIWGRHK